ncbi:MAG: hypothetical protein ABI196_00615 [Bradyrhizobium sp.]
MPIGTIWEGSRASRTALEVYGQARDELLLKRDWPFARQAVSLALLKTAPVGGYGIAPWTSASPPPPWIYEYGYPASCIMVRALRGVPFIIPDFDPKPRNFVIANDASLGTTSKVILTNLAGAQAVITGRIVDPTIFDPGFTEALVSALALRLQEALSPDAQQVKDRAAEEQSSAMIADARRG